jgi:hypothetical protein
MSHQLFEFSKEERIKISHTKYRETHTVPASLHLLPPLRRLREKQGWSVRPLPPPPLSPVAGASRSALFDLPPLHLGFGAGTWRGGRREGRGGRSSVGKREELGGEGENVGARRRKVEEGGARRADAASSCSVRGFERRKATEVALHDSRTIRRSHPTNWPATKKFGSGGLELDYISNP